jgi:MoaA/NifB/PqqE/SkfB family radical SAM enzyme
MEVPKLINWAITNRCNLSCGFCFKLQDKDASFEEQKVIFDKMLESGVEQITFTGGEPLLEKNIVYFADLCNKHSIKSSLHTNATLTEQFYAVYNLFDRISFSLDGNTSSINQTMRGYDLYLQSVLEKINYLKEHNRDFVIKTVVTKQNIDSVLDMVSLVKELKPTFWSIFEFRQLRTGKQNNDKFLLPNGLFEKLTAKIKNQIDKEVEVNIRSNDDSAKHPIFLVSGNGLVYTNDIQQGDILVGSLIENSVKEIWQKIIDQKGINEQYAQRDLNLKKQI